jgi:hypothetical protein
MTKLSPWVTLSHQPVKTVKIISLLGALALTLPALAQDTTPLPLVLPKANFIGTPADLVENPHLEPVRTKPRAIPQVPKGTVNLALNKPVTSSAAVPFSGALVQITDGIKDAKPGNTVELKPRLQWVQLDLGASCELSYIVVWHFHEVAVVFRDVIVQVSNDPEFKTGVVTLFNNDWDNSGKLGEGKNLEYVESNEGKLVAANKTKARYVRLYSRGSTFTDPLNRYTEVEVFGLPAR